VGKTPTRPSPLPCGTIFTHGFETQYVSAEGPPHSESSIDKEWECCVKND
jgi:hypothetical protein